MKITLSLFLVALLVCNPAFAADDNKKPSDAPSAEFDAKMMEMWMKLNAKGEAHAEFQESVGKWKVEETHYMGAEPLKGSGTVTFRTILDGRYLVQEYKSESPLGKYEGLGIMAYDNSRKQYVSVWLDNMSTGVFTSYGKKKGNTITLNGRQKMPNDTVMQQRLILKEATPDKTIMTMQSRFQKQKKFVKQAEIIYSRVK